MEIDIRPKPAVPVTSVRFADDTDDPLVAITIDIGSETLFITGSSEAKFVKIVSREHATNLIKALGKAIDIKWPPKTPRG